MTQKFENFYSKSIWCINIILLIIFLQACHKKEKHTTTNNHCISDSMFRILAFDTIQLRNIVEEVKLNGKITFNEDKVVRMYLPVGGIVEKLNVSLGDYVEKGQVLAQVRSSEMAGYTSEYKTALSNLKIAKKNMDVTEELAKTGVASQKDFLDAKENYEIAVAEVNRTRRVVGIFGDSTREIYYMRSPISGYIVDKLITQGMTIKPENDEIAITLSDLRDVWVVANVFEHDIKRIKVGDSAQISTLAYDKPFKGVVAKIHKSLDPLTKVGQLRIVLLNPEIKLQPGMHATVNLITESSEKKLPSVSNDSFIFEENRYFLVEFQDTCTMKIISVKPHAVIGKIAYLEPSAPVGTRVISKHQLLVYSKLNRED